jgi:hypothetical protein
MRRFVHEANLPSFAPDRELKNFEATLTEAIQAALPIARSRDEANLAGTANVCLIAIKGRTAGGEMLARHPR